MNEKIEGAVVTNLNFMPLSSEYNIFVLPATRTHVDLQ
jgi:hypothetical protein